MKSISGPSQLLLSKNNMQTNHSTVFNVNWKPTASFLGTQKTCFKIKDIELLVIFIMSSILAQEAEQKFVFY